MAKDNKPTGGDVIGEEVAVPMDTPITPKTAEPEPIKPAIKKNGVYDTVDEVPEVYRPAVRAALKKVGFNGRRILPVDGELGLTDDRLWVLDALYNCGMFR